MKTKWTIQTNRKAYQNYEIIKQFEAGLSLTGSEAKSIRLNNVKFTDAYVKNVDGRLHLVNLHIPKFEDASYNNHDEQRPRALLLNKSEITKISVFMEETGNAVIPLNVHMSNGRIKVEIALAKGLRKYDKKHKLKEKDILRDTQREMKRY